MNFCSIVDTISGHKTVWWIKNLYKKKKSHTGNNLSSVHTDYIINNFVHKMSLVNLMNIIYNMNLKIKSLGKKFEKNEMC